MPLQVPKMTPNPYRKEKSPNRHVALKSQDGYFCVVDSLLYDFLAYYDWFVQRNRKSDYFYTYLYKNGRKRKAYLHRLVAATPSGLVCHHIDRNSLNNTRGNLRNMTRKEHHNLHSKDTLIVKFEDTVNHVNSTSQTGPNLPKSF